MSLLSDLDFHDVHFMNIATHIYLHIAIRVYDFSETPELLLLYCYRRRMKAGLQHDSLIRRSALNSVYLDECFKQGT
jgi:hypothetical protein